MSRTVEKVRGIMDGKVVVVVNQRNQSWVRACSTGRTYDQPVKPWPAGQDKRTRRGIGDSGKG